MLLTRFHKKSGSVRTVRDKSEVGEETERRKVLPHKSRLPSEKSFVKISSIRSIDRSYFGLKKDELSIPTRFNVDSTSIR